MAQGEPCPDSTRAKKGNRVDFPRLDRHGNTDVELLRPSEGGYMTVLRIACLLVFAFAVSGLASAADEGKSMPKDVPDFDVHGISMTECQCTAYACPCRSNGHPDHGSCDAADFTYIKHGHYGKVDMSGFKAVVIGDLIDHDASKVQGTAYFDKSSKPEQRAAFSEMLAFMFGWNPPHIVGSKVVSIDFKVDKNTYTLTIP